MHGESGPDVDADLGFGDKAALVDYLGGTPLAELEQASRVKVSGNSDAAARFAGYFDPPPHMSRILVTLHGPA